MRLKKLYLKNFRGFEDLHLDFHPEVTVIAGINGSGKTSILDSVVGLLAANITRRYHRSATVGALNFNKMDCRSGQHHAEASLKVAFGDSDIFIFKALYQNENWDKVDGPSIEVREPQLQTGPLPILPYYEVNRHAEDKTPGSTAPGVWRAEQAWDPIRGNTHFNDLFLWFREREDLENEERRDNPSYVDHQLQAVRDALVTLLPGYESPRVRRPRFGAPGDGGVAVDKPVLALTKNGGELAFSQLSEGERTTAALACDMARRLAIANPTDPLKGEGVALIDEIDLHLHPKWQAEIIPALRKTFPNLQLVVTTHSPVVLSYVESEAVRLIKDFRLVENPTHAKGRDPNAILTDIFDTPLRPKELADRLHHVATLIDEEDLVQAKQDLDALRQELGEDDRDVARLDAMLGFLEP